MAAEFAIVFDNIVESQLVVRLLEVDWAVVKDSPLLIERGDLKLLRLIILRIE